MESNRSNEVLVSVVMPAYGCAATICQAVDSALIQGIPLEILVLNDHAPGDRRFEELDVVMEAYRGVPHVRYVKNEENLGAAATRNRGVELARGRYIAFLDADDWWEKDKLKKQIAKLEQEGLVLCSTGRELITFDGKRTGRVISVRETITYQSLLLHNCINCSSVLVKAEVMREFPMAHEDSHEDYIAWLGILKKYRRAAAINEPLLKYRLSAKGKSGSKLRSAGMTYKAYRYAGFSAVSSGALFCAYAVNGVRKYTAAYLKGRRGM